MPEPDTGDKIRLLPRGTRPLFVTPEPSSSIGRKPRHIQPYEEGDDETANDNRTRHVGDGVIGNRSFLGGRGLSSILEAGMRREGRRHEDIPQLGVRAGRRRTGRARCRKRWVLPAKKGIQTEEVIRPCVG
jgi:hypothetical protein